MSERINTEEVIAERDRILLAMDVDAAKRFIADHGGGVTKRPIDWIRILHLARLEATRLPESTRTESRIWLARNGAQSVAMLPTNSPYLAMTMAILFPEDLFRQTLDDMAPGIGGER